MSIHAIQETVGRNVNVRNQLLYKSLGKAVDLCSTSETRNKKVDSSTRGRSMESTIGYDSYTIDSIEAE